MKILFLSIFLLNFSLHSSLNKNISYAKSLIFNKGNIGKAKKVLEKTFEKYKKTASKEKLNEILMLLNEYTNKNKEEIYKLCKDTNINCTLYKAFMLEGQGSSGSALALYKRGGFFKRYIRLRALCGEDIKTTVKLYNILDWEQNYYIGLSLFSRGEHEEAVKYFLESSKSHMSTLFYLGFSYLMLGKFKEAVESLNIIKNNKKINFMEKIDFLKKLEALILYAKNKQFLALKEFKKILKYRPKDYITRKFIAHIFYRTGHFDKAENIYKNLIKKEWRDNEIFYLYKERSIMRLRYGKIGLAQKDANKTIKEFKNRKDFVVEFISVLLEYAYHKEAKKYYKMLKDLKTDYEKSLKFFVLGLIYEYYQKLDKALLNYKKAKKTFNVDTYSYYIKRINQNKKHLSKNPLTVANCSKYKVKKIKENVWFVESNKFTKTWPVKYFLKKDGDKYSALINVYFDKDKRMKFDYKNWIKYIEKVWSEHNFKLKIKVRNNLKSPYTNKISLRPWPSYFYLLRDSSHNWSLLTAKNVLAHEVGHLLGLDDEYYEMNKKLKLKNKDRIIGSIDSIMRNMISGKPEKRHIHFIISPIKCINN
jgi:tetratricopeptide (TPR) repeat protein